MADDKKPLSPEELARLGTYSYSADETPDADSLPEQGGGSYLTILPQTLMVRLPSNLAQCYEVFLDPVFLDDERTKPDLGPDGQQRTVPRIKWTFDSNAPLVILAPGKPDLHEQPCPNVTVTNIPRRRSKKPDVPKVAESTFLLREALQDASPIGSPNDWIQVMARHAGKVVMIQTGLSAFCNDKKKRYVGIPVWPDTVPVEQRTQANIGLVKEYQSIEDPAGNMGCGLRWYTNDFKVARTQDNPLGYVDRRFCWGKKPTPEHPKTGCGAYLRGFFTVEKWMPVPAGTGA